MCIWVCMRVYICMYMWQPKFKVRIFLNHSIHYHLLLWVCFTCYVCMPVHMWIHVCHCAWMEVLGQPQALGLMYSMVIETRTLSCCSLLWMAGQLDGEYPEILCVYFLSYDMHVDIINVDITHSFMWALGVWSRFPCLSIKGFATWAISLAPT